MLKQAMQYWVPAATVLTAAFTIGAFGTRVADMRGELDDIEATKPDVMAADLRRQGAAIAAGQARHASELAEIERQLAAMRADLAQVRVDAAFVRGLLETRRAPEALRVPPTASDAP